MKPNDISQSPETPQFPLGATSDEAEMHAQLVRSHINGPGDIVARLGNQFQIPRASTDAGISRDMHGED